MPVLTTQPTYIGRPCYKGHDGLRFARTSNCVHCHREMAAERKRRRYWKDPEKHRAIQNKYQFSEKGKLVALKHRESGNRKKAQKKYNNSEKGAASKERYSGSEKQKACLKRAALQPKAKLARSLRDRVRKILKRGKGARAGSAVRDLGCSLDFFKAFIEGKFTDGMSWENYGKWHLDHIKPLKLFDLTDREQFLEACHYTNYQPLWDEDNRRKAARYEAA